MLALVPLLDCPQKEIRDGVRSLFATRHAEMHDERSVGWTGYQIADEFLREAIDLSYAKNEPFVAYDIQHQKPYDDLWDMTQP
ncbi:MAG: hypothetical protein AAFP90_10080 [Planctomycetota bacterium]